MENYLVPGLVFAVVVIAIIYSVVKKNKNRQLAAGGGDMERLRKAAEPLLTDGGRLLYSHWEKVEHYGRTTKTTYFRYAIVYREKILYVAPLYIDKKTGTMQIDRPAIFTHENLGKISVVPVRKKDGNVKHVSLHLISKQGETLYQLDVESENFNSDRFHPVNIIQQEEINDFESVMSAFADRVSAENPGVEDIIKANNYKGLAIFGAVIAIIGAVLGAFFAPIGIGAALIGLIMTFVAKSKGSKVTAQLVICIVCLVLCLGVSISINMFIS